MNTKLLEKINKALLREDGKREPLTQDTVMEFLEESAIEEKITGSHRWYDDTACISEIGWEYFWYSWFHMTGDNSMWDMDLEWDMDSVFEAEKYQKVITSFRPKTKQ